MVQGSAAVGPRVVESEISRVTRYHQIREIRDSRGYTNTRQRGCKSMDIEKMIGGNDVTVTIGLVCTQAPLVPILIHMSIPSTLRHHHQYSLIILTPLLHHLTVIPSQILYQKHPPRPTGWRHSGKNSRLIHKPPPEVVKMARKCLHPTLDLHSNDCKSVNLNNIVT
jgi:hypothetical protein